jgi:hypothetical protein
MGLGFTLTYLFKVDFVACLLVIPEVEPEIGSLFSGCRISSGMTIGAGPA